MDTPSINGEPGSVFTNNPSNATPLAKRRPLVTENPVFGVDRRLAETVALAGVLFGKGVEVAETIVVARGVEVGLAKTEHPHVGLEGQLELRQTPT
jgi:hypothetical protein